MILTEYPRPESAPPPPMWMGIVSAICLIGATGAMIYQHTSIAGLGFVIVSALMLLARRSQAKAKLLAETAARARADSRSTDR